MLGVSCHGRSINPRGNSYSSLCSWLRSGNTHCGSDRWTFDFYIVLSPTPDAARSLMYWKISIIENTALQLSMENHPYFIWRRNRFACFEVLYWQWIKLRWLNVRTISHQMPLQTTLVLANSFNLDIPGFVSSQIVCSRAANCRRAKLAYNVLKAILHEDCQYVNKLLKTDDTQFRQTINICWEQMQFISVFCDWMSHSLTRNKFVFYLLKVVQTRFHNANECVKWFYRGIWIQTIKVVSWLRFDYKRTVQCCR